MATISERESRQIDEANESGQTPVVFVHGLWVLPGSWEPERESCPRGSPASPSRSRPRLPEGGQSAKSGRSARALAARPFGSSHCSWRPSAVRSSQ